MEEEKKENDEAIKRFTDFYSLFNEIEQITLFEVDVKGNFTTFSYKWGEMFGYTIEEAKKITNALQVIAPSDRKRVAENLQRVLPVVTTKDLEYRGLRKNTMGWEEFPVLLYTRPIIQGNKITGRRGILIDITNLKKMEGKVKELNETLKLINIIIRHDISNDLTLLSGLIKLYQLKQDPELLDRALKIINKSGTLINKMKLLEQSTSDDITQETFVARDVIENVVTSYNLSELGIAITIQGNAMIVADITITSVIDNILSNVVKHANASTVDIVIEDLDNCSQISIADNGRGIPADYKMDMFEPGLQLRDSQSQGAGLGLYTVYKNVERYGGKIWIEDNEPTGCVFKIKLQKPDVTERVPSKT